ncbi:ChaN family lipoprotein [Shimia sp.]|uniref:ChaN family lipoprotein n=1 Tax=Shimia sp. TaxID=1954381 RepID=UPI00329714DC
MLKSEGKRKMRKGVVPSLFGCHVSGMRFMMCLTLTVFAAPLAAEIITPDQIERFRESDVVFLGELHDNPHHHANQAAAVSALRPGAVVFEMLTPDKAALITPELLSDEGELARKLDWAQSGWPDFAMYYPIFQASEGAMILGAQVTREDARAAVMGDGVTARFGEDADQYGLTDALPEAQQSRREAMQMSAHCDALPETMLAGMVMVQRYRDATLARAVTHAAHEVDGPVVVITGNGHARTDWGVPSLLPKELNVVSIAQLEQPPEPGQPHDYWVVTDPAEREDPCKAFQ